MLTAEQVLQRTHFIGGSDAAAVLGLSRWKTPLAVWAEKTGLVTPEDISDRLSVKMGNKLEDAVADLFAEETGKVISVSPVTMFHADYPFLGANLDRWIESEKAILECKTTNGRRAAEWEGDDIPQEYIVQCMHYMAVTGAEAAYIAVLIGGNEKFVWKRIERDDRAIKTLIEKEVKFWRTFVEPKVQPTLESITWADSDTLFRLYPHGKEETPIQLTDEANRLVESITAMKTDYRALERQIDTEENRLKAMLGENAIGTTGIYRVTWKEQSEDRIDTKRFKEEQPAMAHCYTNVKSKRVLRIANEKKEG